MKRSSAIILAVLATSTLLFAALRPQVDDREKETLIFHALMTVMDIIHFEPEDVDDEFSEKAFNQFLEGIDGAKRFFLQSEVDQLKVYQKLIDDQVKQRSFTFFDQVVELVEPSIKRGKRIYQEVIAQDFDLTIDESLELDGDKRVFASNEAELKEFWRQSLKYQILSKVYQKNKNQEDTEDDKEKKSFEELVAESTKETKDLYDDYFDRMLELRRSDHFDTYMNVFTQLYDPHSSYFSPVGKEEFDIRFGGKLEGIGARLVKTDGAIRVNEIIPGGPAWKGKELEVEDIIFMVAEKGAEGVDLTGMRLDDAVQLIRGDKGTTVMLSIRKKDGSIKEIEIVRDEVIIDAAFAKSLILDIGDQIEDIGYIHLPTFYSTFDGGNSCAADVAKEIDKLKSQQVNGIILDLRYNGGGSLQDVVDMSGLFIEQGPVVQVKAKDRKAEVLSDEDPNVAYDGPLIVMVNSISASASEILAAALQDYKRAVIVGGNSTFGKATVQGFYDLDRVIRDYDDLKPLGEVKLTMQKFYRINGGSNQLRGVIPDVVLPDRFSYIEVGEKEYEEALGYSEIASTDFGQSVYELSDLKQIKANSQERIANDATFQLIDEQAKFLKENSEDTELPLSFEGYGSEMKKREEAAKRFSDLMDKQVDGLQASYLPQDISYIDSDESRKARFEDFMKQAEKDIHLRETLYIMQDMLEAKKRLADRE